MAILHSKQATLCNNIILKMYLAKSWPHVSLATVTRTTLHLNTNDNFSIPLFFKFKIADARKRTMLRKMIDKFAKVKYLFYFLSNIH